MFRDRYSKLRQPVAHHVAIKYPTAIAPVVRKTSKHGGINPRFRPANPSTGLKRDTNGLGKLTHFSSL